MFRDKEVANMEDREEQEERDNYVVEPSSIFNRYGNVVLISQLKLSLLSDLVLEVWLLDTQYQHLMPCQSGVR